MADYKKFLKIKRQDAKYRKVSQRVKDFQSVTTPRSYALSKQQSSRCMDCGTPFCHCGCPLGNYIPEWNDYMVKGNWHLAYKLLNKTNNMPEVTARVCPSLCEYACVLGISDEPVTIMENELAVIEYAFENGLVVPGMPKKRTGKKIAVIGSGPAGLSTAVQLNKAGHSVTVFERDEKIGGLLRFGIPDFKLEKHILDRRIKIWKKEGVEFKTKVNVGKDFPASKLIKKFDAICLACGSRSPRDLNIQGRELKNIYFAMNYLTGTNRKVAGKAIAKKDIIDAKNKNVVIIGGGDTGADCLGVANRQGAKSVTQIELMPKPPQTRTEDYPWPNYAPLLKETSSHQEGCKRYWSILTKRFIGQKGRVKKLECIKVKFTESNNKAHSKMEEIKGSNFSIKADLIILAIGFLHTEHKGLILELKVDLDNSGNIKTDENYMTSKHKVFSAGDARRGQSLVTWAVSEGRRCAYNIDKFLMKQSDLPLM